MLNQTPEHEVKNDITTELTYGLKNGQLLSIHDVEQGLACGCVCPGCGAELIARKGSQRAHHFAHHNSAECNYGPESALHFRAKNVFLTEPYLLLPFLMITDTEAKRSHPELNLIDVIESEVALLSQVEIEKHLGSFKPDVTAVLQTGEQIDIEIHVSHKVDMEKHRKVQSLGRLMLEIDLSKVARNCTEKELIEQVLWRSPRYFIYHPAQQAKKQLLTQKLKQFHEKILETTLLNKVPEKADLELKNDDEVLILGFKIGSGYSSKYKSDFSLSNLFISKTVQKHSTTNFKLECSGGLVGEEQNMHPSLAEKLSKLKFPVKAKLIYEPRPASSGYKTNWVIVDFELKD
jgi:hypothetical protein